MCKKTFHDLLKNTGGVPLTEHIYYIVFVVMNQYTTSTLKLGKRYFTFQKQKYYKTLNNTQICYKNLKKFFFQKIFGKLNMNSLIFLDLRGRLRKERIAEC